MHRPAQLSPGYDEKQPTTLVDGDVGVSFGENQVDVTDLITQILANNSRGVAEGLSGQSSISWDASQVVNDALASF